MDADEIFSKQLHQMEKEKKERDGKLKAQEKKVRLIFVVMNKQSGSITFFTVSYTHLTLPTIYSV